MKWRTVVALKPIIIASAGLKAAISRGQKIIRVRVCAHFLAKKTVNELVAECNQKRYRGSRWEIFESKCWELLFGYHIVGNNVISDHCYFHARLKMT